MIAMIPRETFTSARLDELLLAAGFVRAADFPIQSGIHEVKYRHGEGWASVIAGAEEGAIVLSLDGVEEAIAARLARALEPEDPAALIAAAQAAVEPRVALRALARLAVLFHLPALPTYDAAMDVALARLGDPHPLVRRTAAQITWSASRKVEAALSAAKDRFPELAGIWEGVRAMCEAREDGTLGDRPTDDVRELERRAVEGTEKKQWKRVAQAAEAWLAERPADEVAACYRALGHRGSGEVLLALARIAGGVRGLGLSVQVARKIAAEGDDEDATRDAVEKEQTLARWSAELGAIQAEARALPPEARSDAGLFELFERWARETQASAGNSAFVLGAAGEALAGLVPELEPLLRWLRVSSGIGATDEDRAALLRDAVDSPWVWHRAAQRLSRDDQAASDRAYDEALRLVRAGEAPRPLAARIARLQELAGEVLNEVVVLEAQLRAAYDRKDWNTAAARADELAAAAPNSIFAWQVRANARCFALRHEEAVPACEDAIREIGRVIADGGEMYLNDPRTVMEYNRACMLAKLGRREEALEGLRRAVKGDESWAAKAAKDGDFQALWEDPELLAIVRGDPAARLLVEEKTPAQVLALLQQANQAIAGLDALRAVGFATRALSLARLLGAAAHAVSAGMIAGYVTAVNGDVDGGLALARTARAELDALGDVDPRYRAEQLGEYVTTLTVAERWDEAESACEEARAARAAAFGAVSLPVVLSHNQLASIQVARGAPSAERLATFDRAGALLDELLSRTPDDAEAHAQRGTILARRVDLTEDAGARVELLEGAAAALVRAAELGALRAQHIDGVLLAVEQVIAPGDLRERLGAVHERLTALLFPDPEERLERQFWRRIRHDVRGLRRIGHDDAAIVAMLTELLRGGTPDAVRDLGVFAGFAEHMARHMADHGMLAVLAPMTLQTAAASGDVLGAVDQLEGLILGGDGDEDDDEDDDEVEDE